LSIQSPFCASIHVSRHIHWFGLKLQQAHLWQSHPSAPNASHENCAQHIFHFGHRGSPNSGISVLDFFFFALCAGTVGSLMAGEWVAGIVLSVSAGFSALLIHLIVRRVQVIFDRNGDTITFRA
jgi:hypothetical protein